MKFTKRYETESDYTSAKPKLILPNVSLVSESSKVYYNPKKAKLYDYLYSDLTYGTEVKDNIIGVCVIGEGILPDKKARFISIKPMSLSTPDVGGYSEVTFYWGGYGVDTSLKNLNKVVTGDTSASGYAIDYSYLPKNGAYSLYTPHSPSPIDYFAAYSDTTVTTANSLSDFDGKSNTKVLTDLATAQSDWKTAAITNNSGSGYYPAACACWRFNPGNTNQGDWYLPAMGELGFVIVNFDEINSKINAASGVQLNGGKYYWSSTEYDSDKAGSLYMDYGHVVGIPKNKASFFIRAFLAL